MTVGRKTSSRADPVLLYIVMPSHALSFGNNERFINWWHRLVFGGTLFLDYVHTFIFSASLCLFTAQKQFWTSFRVDVGESLPPKKSVVEKGQQTSRVHLL